MAKVARRRNRWVIDFYGQDDFRRWKTMPEGTTKNDATEELAKTLKKVNHGTFKPSGKLPRFSAVAQDWLDSKESEVRHSTHHAYKGHVTNHLKPFFKGVIVSRVSFRAIERFKKHCLDNGMNLPHLERS